MCNRFLKIAQKYLDSSSLFTSSIPTLSEIANDADFVLAVQARREAEGADVDVAAVQAAVGLPDAQERFLAFGADERFRFEDGGRYLDRTCGEFLKSELEADLCTCSRRRA
jgi:hypothetical protein